MVIYFRMGKTYTAKTPLSDFKVTTPENPLLSQQVDTSKGIPVPYTNLQLNLYPNTQLDLFYCDNLSFQCTTPSTWLTNRCADPSTDLITSLGKMLATKCWIGPVCGLNCHKPKSSLNSLCFDRILFVIVNLIQPTLIYIYILYFNCSRVL